MIMNKTAITLALSLSSLTVTTYADNTKNPTAFKRFSISAGWLHAAPQGSANVFNNSTSVQNGDYRVGDVQLGSVTDAIAPTVAGEVAKAKLLGVASTGKLIGLVKNDTLTADMSGRANINSLESWQSPGTGLEAQPVDTLGLLFNYYLTDHWSLEFKAGIPPKVDIQGKGQIYAPLTGVATPEGNISGALGIVANPLVNSIGEIPLDKQIYVTDLSQGNKTASARAWLPAAEVHYQFGKSGVNKFRPYVGAGIIYGYFDKVELNPGIEADLVNSAHKIQNIMNNQAGAALDGKPSNADPRVKVTANDAFAPIVTLGATYDFNANWFAVGSVSYAKMGSDTTITVTDQNTGNQLIHSKTKIDIDPVISYVGIGYRF